MRKRNSTSRGRARAFTLVEVMVSTIIVCFFTVGLLVFLRYAGVLVTTVTNQAVHNQEAGSTAELIVKRMRVCNAFTVTNSGNTLTLKFDDDPNTDSDGDGNKFNDVDHVEVFNIDSGDGSLTTLADNTITYQPSAASSVRVLARRVSKIGAAAFFTSTGTRSVDIKFAISGGENGATAQRVEMITSAYRLN